MKNLELVKKQLARLLKQANIEDCNPSNDVNQSDSNDLTGDDYAHKVFTDLLDDLEIPGID